MSPYRGGPPPRDDEPIPDFRSPSTDAREEAFYCTLAGAIPAAATFVTIPLASAALVVLGLAAGTLAYVTHDRRRGNNRHRTNLSSGKDERAT